jgi:hypothetical protein
MAGPHRRYREGKQVLIRRNEAVLPFAGRTHPASIIFGIPCETGWT